MKKGLQIFGLICVTLFISGCNPQDEASLKEEILNCTFHEADTVNGYQLDSKYKVFSKGGIIDKVEITETVISDKKEILEQYEKKSKESYDKMNQTYGGYTYDINKKDENVVIILTIDYQKFNLKQAIQDDATMKQYVNKDNKLTLKGIESLYKTMDITCEKSS